MTEYSSLLYELKVDIDGYETNDISEFSVFRCPFIKTSSFAMLTLNVQTIIFIGVETECKKHNYMTLKLTIKQNDMSKTDPKEYGETKEITTKTYLIINVQADEKPDLESKYTSMTVYLVNPVLYYLNTTNSYNKIIEDKTGLDILKDYESHLTSLYGDKTFDFKKIGDSKNKNEFQYEQLLIRVKNDLLVPTWILQNHRPFNSFAFYFFDDFCITKQNKKDIIGYLINLDDKEQFNKIDCLEDPTEVSAGNKFIKTYVLNDVFNELSQENPSKVVCGSDGQFKYKKAESQNSVPNMRSQNSSEQLEPNREVKTVSSSLEKKDKQPTEQTILYTSDDIDGAISRLETVKKQISEKLETASQFYLRDSHLDFFQFGNIYNIDPFVAQGYFYTPISIVNVFKRSFGKVPLANHHCHYILLKFKEDS